MSATPVLVVGLVLQCPDGIVLVHKRNPQMWALPGGKVDPEDGFDPLIAAQRELSEECGITVDVARFKPVPSWHSDMFRDKKLQAERRFFIVYYHVDITPAEQAQLRNCEPEKHLDVAVLPLTDMHHLRDHDRHAVEMVVGNLPPPTALYIEWRTQWAHGPDEWGRIAVTNPSDVAHIEAQVYHLGLAAKLAAPLQFKHCEWRYAVDATQTIVEVQFYVGFAIQTRVLLLPNDQLSNAGMHEHPSVKAVPDRINLVIAPPGIIHIIN